MEVQVDAIASPLSFEEEDTGLVELAIAPEDEEKYPFVRPSSAQADLMDRPGRAMAQWENMDFDERIQADPTYIIANYRFMKYSNPGGHGGIAPTETVFFYFTCLKSAVYL